jgi:hypothetical protein
MPLVPVKPLWLEIRLPSSAERVMTLVPLTRRILPSVNRAWCGRSPETGTYQTMPLAALYETRWRTPSRTLMNSSRSFCSS